MSKSLNIFSVETNPELWGVSVKWKWPEESTWGRRLELQCLFSDGRLKHDLISWPVTGTHIGGLKAGERVQIRLRPIDKNGNSPEWSVGDWTEGVSSANAGDYLNNICVDIIKSPIHSSLTINDAFLQPGSTQSEQLDKAVISSSYSIQVNSNEGGKQRVGGTLSVKGNLYGAQIAATKIKLSDEMREAVVDAVRNSVLFESLRTELNGQTASVASLQQAIHDIANDAIRNAMKPGGMLYGR
ncbi:hypothetical protein FR773_10190 [Leclercia adecarboxylata]|uniref:hypothetical protein n=1 Tax=Leclercia adecarboxylata TaxID=83655 RepID=UPI0012A7C5E4|nr:hypothetical protein [Leclercia adecarboxylata]QFH65078.1 hypothetical protein FR773_10190 [Leclercia adecarboxylata]